MSIHTGHFFAKDKEEVTKWLLLHGFSITESVFYDNKWRITIVHESFIDHELMKEMAEIFGAKYEVGVTFC